MQRCPLLAWYDQRCPYDAIRLTDPFRTLDQSQEKLSEYNKILNQAKQEAKKILEGTRKKVNRDI